MTPSCPRRARRARAPTCAQLSGTSRLNLSAVSTYSTSVAPPSADAGQKPAVAAQRGKEASTTARCLALPAQRALGWTIRPSVCWPNCLLFIIRPPVTSRDPSPLHLPRRLPQCRTHLVRGRAAGRPGPVVGLPAAPGPCPRAGSAWTGPARHAGPGGRPRQPRAASSSSGHSSKRGLQARGAALGRRAQSQAAALRDVHANRA